MKQRFSVLSVIAALVAMACVAGAAFAQDAQPLLTRHVREVTRNGQAPSVGSLPATQSMRLTIMLPLRDQAGLESFVKELYDPSSGVYRHFLTVEEFTEMYGPRQEDFDAVVKFAKANGLTVTGTSRNRVAMNVTGSVASVEKAFHVTMGLYQHPTEGRTFYAPDREPTTDAGVQLWHISGLDNYSIPIPALMRKDARAYVHSNATTGSCPSASFCGSDMRAAYYGGTALTGAGQTLGLLEYAGTDLADLNTYFKNAHQTNNVPITLLSVDGTPTSCLERQDCDDTEQTIDMTQAIGMAPGLSSLVMYVGSTDSAIFNAMATASPLNAQLSCSWYWSPADPKTLNPIFIEFAAQGQNLFDAAGDDGKWPPSIWPADNAYLTSVGGTDLETSGAGGPWSSETAWSDGGGGISPNKIPIPSWQVTTAAGCAKCSQTLRNGPDVSANANFTFYVCADQTACSANLYGGTSFAAPMWAGYLALTNQQYLSNGATTTLGFINPALYTIGLGSGYDVAFHDIVSGSNGYQATVGYDLATGWGSPNGDGLVNALAGTAANPDFTISASPSTITIAQGSSGSTTITTTISGGFDAAIALSGPASVSFNPSTIPAPGSGTSTVKVTVGKNVALGDHTLTITGTGGGVTQTTTVTIDVTN